MDAARKEYSRWYVLQTKPKQESRAEMNLRRWQVETLSPKLREQRRSGTGGERVVALFPSYLFARFESGRAGQIRLTRGIQRIVGFGEYATPVDDEVIRLIQSRIGDDGFVRAPDLQPGDVVEVLQGPLRSLVGAFERRCSARDRVLILIQALGSNARVELSRDAIRRTQPTA